MKYQLIAQKKLRLRNAFGNSLYILHTVCI